MIPDGFEPDYGDMEKTGAEADAASPYSMLPIGAIHVDAEFNSRGRFLASETLELQRDIARRGLVEPIIVRSLWDNEQHLKDKGFQYFLMAGFRRYMAYKCLRTNYAMCAIREVKTDFDARDINAVENLQRKDLTFYQEARSIKHYWVDDIPREDVARRISKSPGWVQQRYALLNMQPEVQDLAERGYIGPGDMNDLKRYHGDERIAFAKKIADSRREGKSQNVTRMKLKINEKKTTQKIRRVTEIEDVMELLNRAQKTLDRSKMIPMEKVITRHGNSIANRILAWAVGNISSGDMYESIKVYIEDLGGSFEMPEFKEPTSTLFT